MVDGNQENHRIMSQNRQQNSFRTNNKIPPEQTTEFLLNRQQNSYRSDNRILLQQISPEQTTVHDRTDNRFPSEQTTDSFKANNRIPTETT